MSAKSLLGFVLIAIGGLSLLARLSEPVAAGWWSSESRLLDTRDETLELDGVRSVQVEAGAGSLRIEGVPKSSAARLHAEFFGEDESTLKQLRLEHGREGSRLLVKARTDDARNGRIDLALELPSGVELVVVDGSGSTVIQGFERAVDVTDGSGSLDIERIGGDLTVTDGSGSLNVLDVGGDLKVTDGSGSIDAESVEGHVEVTDGSGSISILRVGGDVRVTDGSGSIEVRDVDGRFHLLADGSGSVSTSNVRGGAL